jgi:hypothetical protein
LACRFWGTPIPIWASEDGEEIRVIGSIAELEEIAGRKVRALLQNLLHCLRRCEIFVVRLWLPWQLPHHSGHLGQSNIDINGLLAVALLCLILITCVLSC